MALNNFGFLLYLAVLCFAMFILQILRKNEKYRNTFQNAQKILLLLFSYFFIAKTDWRFCICIMAVTVISYITGILAKGKRRQALVAGIILLVGILIYFKYCNFFIESINSLIHSDIHTLSIILPVGLSFYVFSALSYIIDVYRGTLEPEKNIVHYAIYVSFFPKLTAGPIVRANEFFPQLNEYRGIEKQAFLNGIQIFVFGLFKKIVLADHLSVFVNDVFFSPTAYNTGTIILGVLSYSLQIYFDFSGYSDMAIGIAKILGFDFNANFNLPYIAENISDFWNRWHISLSSWLRDYIYFPLGGSRKGQFRTFINLMIVMLVSGLWHGVGWTFIMWGVLHGVLSCLHRTVRNWKIHRSFSTIFTFISVSLLWVFFRAESLTKAFDVFKGMFTLHSGINQPYTWTFFSLIVLLIATVLAYLKTKNKTEIKGFYPILDLSKFWNLVLFFTFCGITIIMGYFGNTAFIYGKF